MGNIDQGRGDGERKWARCAGGLQPEVVPAGAPPPEGQPRHSGANQNETRRGRKEDSQRRQCRPSKNPHPVPRVEGIGRDPEPQYGKDQLQERPQPRQGERQDQRIEPDANDVDGTNAGPAQGPRKRGEGERHGGQDHDRPRDAVGQVEGDPQGRVGSDPEPAPGHDGATCDSPEAPAPRERAQAKGDESRQRRQHGQGDGGHEETRGPQPNRVGELHLPPEPPRPECPDPRPHQPPAPMASPAVLDEPGVAGDGEDTRPFELEPALGAHAGQRAAPLPGADRAREVVAAARTSRRGGGGSPGYHGQEYRGRGVQASVVRSRGS